MDLGGPKEAQAQSYSPGGAMCPHGKYDSTVHLLRRCGLLSNDFGHLLLLLLLSIVRPRHSTTLHRCRLLLPTKWRCLSVSLSVTLVSPTRTAAPIEMPLGLRTQVGPRNHVLEASPVPPMGKGNLEGRKGHPIVKYRDTVRSSVQKTAEPTEMPFGFWARMVRRSRVLDGASGAKGRCHGNGNQFWDYNCC